VQTALVDRGPAGQGASFGNAGLIQREGVFPYAFPRNLRTLVQAATRRSVAVNYHLAALPRLLPFLLRYWQHSSPAQHARIAKAYSVLIEHSIAETRALTTEAGLSALLRPSGWIKAFRTACGQDAGLADAEAWRREFDVAARPLDRAGLRETEPHLGPDFVGGLHHAQPDAVSDPGALVDGLRRRFEDLGGQFIAGDASTLAPNGGIAPVLDTDDAFARGVRLCPRPISRIHLSSVIR